jgi:hypothetical protein
MGKGIIALKNSYAFRMKETKPLNRYTAYLSKLLDLGTRRAHAEKARGDGLHDSFAKTPIKYKKEHG